MAPIIKTVVWSILIICTLLVCPCRADPIEQAKAKIQAGKTLIAKEDYTRALAAFQESYRLRPKAWVLFNIAMCQKALFKYVEAIKAFKAYLSQNEDPSEMSPAMKKMAQAALNELEQLVGKVQINEAPLGAKVSIDNEWVARTPLTEPLVLDPGRHKIEVTKDGYERLSTDVLAASGAEIVVRAELRPSTAQIQVTCNSKAAVVYLDGIEMGTCPFKGTVEPGQHEIKIEAIDKQPYIQLIAPRADSTVVITANLKTTFEKPKISIPLSKIKEKPLHWLKASGWTAMGLGVISIGLGGYFTYKWNEHYDEVATAANDVDDANDPSTRDTWLKLKKDYDRIRNRVENTDHPKDVKGMTTGYALGGALMITGATLLIWDVIKQKERKPITAYPIPGGMAMQF